MSQPTAHFRARMFEASQSLVRSTCCQLPQRGSRSTFVMNVLASAGAQFQKKLLDTATQLRKMAVGSNGSCFEWLSSDAFWNTRRVILKSVCGTSRRRAIGATSGNANFGKAEAAPRASAQQVWGGVVWGFMQRTRLRATFKHPAGQQFLQEMSFAQRPAPVLRASAAHGDSLGGGARRDR